MIPEIQEPVCNHQAFSLKVMTSQWQWLNMRYLAGCRDKPWVWLWDAASLFRAWAYNNKSYDMCLVQGKAASGPREIYRLQNCPVNLFSSLWTCDLHLCNHWGIKLINMVYKASQNFLDLVSGWSVFWSPYVRRCLAKLCVMWCFGILISLMGMQNSED